MEELGQGLVEVRRGFEDRLKVVWEFDFGIRVWWWGGEGREREVMKVDIGNGKEGPIRVHVSGLGGCGWLSRRSGWAVLEQIGGKRGGGVGSNGLVLLRGPSPPLPVFPSQIHNAILLD